MNKEQIEEAEKKRESKIIEALNYILGDKDLALGYCGIFESIIDDYLESKREEIERKAWIAGFIEKASRFYISDMEDEEVANKFYDQWKESQKKEQ